MALHVLYGGTFDPVHNGHVAVARHARDALAADIYLMPAHDPPHKGPTHASADQRAQMLQLAVQGEPGLHVDLRELRRTGPSFTVDTLREVRCEIGSDQPLAILIGADSFRSLDTWSRWRELFPLAHIVVAERDSERLEDAEDLPRPLAAETDRRWAKQAQELHARASGRIFALHQPMFPQSASELRRRLAADEPWRHWVHPDVAEYIAGHGLYR